MYRASPASPNLIVPVTVSSDAPASQTINQTINTYNTMNNFLNGIDALTKIREYGVKKQIHYLPFDRDVELMYEKQRLRLENNTFVHEHQKEEIEIIEMINHISKCCEKDMSDFNLCFDNKQNKLLMYESGDWQELFTNAGIQKIVTTIQDYFWNAYECFLIRKIEKCEDQVRMRELLEKHYTFLACADVDPFVLGRHNNQINYTADDDEYWEAPAFTDIDAHSIQDYYLPMFRRIQKGLSKKAKEDAKKEIIQIVKSNTRNNMMQLNKLIVRIIDVEPNFQAILIR